MPIDPAAFRHHPRLQGQITDPDTSFFRTFNPAEFDNVIREQGGRTDWRYPDEVRTAMMAETLGDRLNDDVWVFGYGSLMWDPGFHFSEIRRARITGYRRAMALYDAQGARGTADAPGLMAALVEGGTVDGVVFRIDAAHAADEVEVVWRREMVGPGYLARFLPAETDQGRVEALAFVGDTTQEDIRPDLPRADIVRYIATGEGILGSSLDYLRNMLIHFREMGIPDPDLEALMDEVLAYRAD